MRRIKRSWVRLPSIATDFKILAALVGASIFCIYLMNLYDITPPKEKILRRPADSLVSKIKDGVGNNEKPLVILLAQFRTGSTLLGEMFNKNPDMFYLFEPLSILKCLKQKGGMMNMMENNVGKLLRRFSRCEFSIESASCIGNTSMSVTHSKNVRRVCRLVTGLEGVRCPLAHPGFYRNECRRSSKTVAVTITRADLKDLEDLLRMNPNSNVKVIHLVRDPRAVANSRRLFLLGADERHYIEQATVKRPRDLPIRSLEDMGMFESTLKPAKARLSDLCFRMRQNLHMAAKRPRWLGGRYKLIRYEDFIRDPFTITKDIYSFIGDHRVPASVFQWIDKSNGEIGSQQRREPEEEVDTSDRFGDSVFPRRIHALSYATRRNSTTSWRNYSKFEDVNTIQSMCDDVMDILGYNLLQNEEEIWDFQIPVIGDTHDNINE